MINYRDPSQSKAQITSFARKVLRRLHSLGAKSHTLEDVEQELWLAWCKACERYNPELGASFATFLYTGMQRHINRYIQQNFERFHEETIALSYDVSLSGNDDEDDAIVADIVPSTQDTQDVLLEREDCFRYAMTRLSPQAQQFMTILKEQPPELLDEVKRLEAKSDYAASRGIRFATAHRITTPMIFDFLGVTRTERRKIMDEITQLGAVLTEQVFA